MRYYENRKRLPAFAALFAVFAAALSMLLSGCGKEYPVKAFTFSDELGGEYRIEYTYNGDAVLEQYQVYVLDYSDIEKNIEDYISEKAKKTKDGYEDIEYVTYKYSIENEVFTEKVTIKNIDRNISNIAGKSLLPVKVSVDDSFVSISEIEQALLSTGWKSAE